MGVQFVIKLADAYIGVDCLHDTTKTFCKDYIVDADTDECGDNSKNDMGDHINITVNQPDIDRERKESEAYDLRHYGKIQKWPDSYLETLALYRKIAEALAERNVLLFHGSAIAVDGKGYLFTGLSGAGKSTHARMWREYFQNANDGVGSSANNGTGDINSADDSRSDSTTHDVFMVNDDKPLIKVTDDGIMICGTPWDGKHRLSRNCQVPLTAIAEIKQATDNSCGLLPEERIWTLLYQQSYHPETESGMKAAIDMLGRIKASTPFYEIKCDMSTRAAEVAWNEMGK